MPRQERARVPSKAAKVPKGYETRTVNVTLDAPFEEWVAVCRADVPLRVFQDLNSTDFDRVLPALDRMVVSHNFPGEDGQVAATMAEVYPTDAVNLLVKGIGEEIGKLPPR